MIPMSVGRQAMIVIPIMIILLILIPAMTAAESNTRRTLFALAILGAVITMFLYLVFGLVEQTKLQGRLDRAEDRVRRAEAKVDQLERLVYRALVMCAALQNDQQFERDLAQVLAQQEFPER